MCGLFRTEKNALAKVRKLWEKVPVLIGQTGGAAIPIKGIQLGDVEGVWMVHDEGVIGFGIGKVVLSTFDMLQGESIGGDGNDD
ncbi:hypothetical protein Tco_1326465 [Tanacetum coccineum]